MVQKLSDGLEPEVERPISEVLKPRKSAISIFFHYIFGVISKIVSVISSIGLLRRQILSEKDVSDCLDHKSLSNPLHSCLYVHCIFDVLQQF